MPKKVSRFQQMRAGAQALLNENALPHEVQAPKWHRFIHFWVLVWRSFVRNRCPVRASALAYASLLALIPMLAVVLSITSTFLKKEGEEQIDHFIIKFITTATTPAVLMTNVPGSTNISAEVADFPASTNQGLSTALSSNAESNRTASA